MNGSARTQMIMTQQGKGRDRGLNTLRGRQEDARFTLEGSEMFPNRSVSRRSETEEAVKQQQVQTRRATLGLGADLGRVSLPCG